MIGKADVGGISWDLTPWLGYGALMYFTTLPLDVSPKEPIFISKVLCAGPLQQEFASKTVSHKLHTTRWIW